MFSVDRQAIIIIIIIINYTLTYARKRVQLDKKHWYEYVPKSLETSQGRKVTILWNQQVQTDKNYRQQQARHYNP